MLAQARKLRKFRYLAILVGIGIVMSSEYTPTPIYTPCGQLGRGERGGTDSYDKRLGLGKCNQPNLDMGSDGVRTLDQLGGDMHMVRA